MKTNWQRANLVARIVSISLAFAGKTAEILYFSLARRRTLTWPKNCKCSETDNCRQFEKGGLWIESSPATEKIMRQNTNSNAQINYDVSYNPDTSDLDSSSTTDLIRKRAYELFQMRGQVPGNELGDWLQAEQETKRRFGI